jgi:hypothetical protein
MQGGCVLSNFSGSNRNFSVTYTHVNNQANGGAVFVSAGSFSDIAGNAYVSIQGFTILTDTWGPSASISRNGRTLTIDFGEVVLNFDGDDLLFTRSWSTGSEQYFGMAGSCSAANPNSPSLFYCDVLVGIDVDYGRGRDWTLEIVGDPTDVDGFSVSPSWWQIPLIDIG